MLKKVNQLLFSFTNILNIIGCGLTMFLMVVIMWDVTGRLLFNSPLTGTTEIVIALIIIIAWLQATFVQNIDAHLNVNIYSSKFPPIIKKVTGIIGKILGIIVFTFLSINSWDNLIRSIKTFETEGDGALVLPMWPVRGVIFFCSIMFIIIFILQTINLIKDYNFDEDLNKRRL